MSSHDDIRAPAHSARAIVDSKQRLDDRVSHYVTTHQLVGEGSAELEQARKTLHIATLDLHQRMKNHSRNTIYWDPDETVYEDEDAPLDGPIWSGTHPLLGPVTITGLRDLNEWRDRTVRRTVDLEGPKHSPTDELVEVRLPAAAALDVADVLAKVFEDCGWDAQQAVTDIWEEEPI